MAASDEQQLQAQAEDELLVVQRVMQEVPAPARHHRRPMPTASTVVGYLRPGRLTGDMLLGRGRMRRLSVLAHA